MRPLKKEPTRLKESLRILNSEVCSEGFETDPNEALRVIVRPLKNELARPRESEKDLKNEFLSTCQGL